jgi:hypothetical protein
VACREAGTTSRPILVDAIAGAMEAYEGTAIHPAWTSQIEDLGARRWWSSGQSPLHQRTEASPAARGVVLMEALRLARVLVTFGSVPVLIPPPGSPRTWDVHEVADPRLLAKVRGLLAKAESTTFPEEAEALTAKAQELMSRHEIDAAMLHAGSTKPAGRRVGIDDPYAESKALLLQRVAEANGCRAVWSKAFGSSTVVGFDEQIELVELLYTSLLVQSTAAMVRAGRASASHRQPSFRRSFLQAFAVRIGVRLEEARCRVVEEASLEQGDGLLPVLAARRSTVDEAFDELFPTITTSGSRSVDPMGWRAGEEAANQADLGQPRVRPSPGGQRSLPGESPAV